MFNSVWYAFNYSFRLENIIFISNVNYLLQKKKLNNFNIKNLNEYHII